MASETGTVRANHRGNAAALAKWRAENPNYRDLMRKAALKKAKLTRQRQAAVAAATGVAPGRALAIAVHLRENGGYVAGSSRSFTIEGCPATPDELRAAIRDLLPKIRQQLEAKGRPVRQEAVRW